MLQVYVLFLMLCISFVVILNIDTFLAKRSQHYSDDELPAYQPCLGIYHAARYINIDDCPL